jgi:hypothetical protein
MQLDDLKNSWAAHGAVLERSLVINERLLRELFVRKLRFALAPFVLWRALEVALWIAALGLVVPVLLAHFREPRYLVVAGGLALYVLVITILSAQILVGVLRLDYHGPVAAIQRDVEQLKLAEYRAFKWALLGGVPAWWPAVIVLLEALSGVDLLTRVGDAFLLANLGFGFLVLALGQWLSKRYVEQSKLAPFARRTVDALSGRSLRIATNHLAELALFSREEPPPG